MVAAILAKPEISTPAKYAFLYTEQGPFRDQLQIWSEVTGRRATYVHVPQAEYESIWGKEFGKEMALMFRPFEQERDWGKPYSPNVITPSDLGIAPDELVGVKATLEREKERL